MNTEHLDVIIVGGGLSGIGAAYHLQTECPGKSFTVLEGRDTIGGTWDLFRYPGIRSDSDMYTLGYSFRPWPDATAIADGPAILRYIRDTAAEFGIDRKIRFGHRVTAASWSSDAALWTLEIERGPGHEPLRLTCSFLFACTGYYDYDEGYQPAFAGMERFEGQVVHPQKWPASLDYAGKNIVVIGSGATAVTLVPSLANSGGKVTMLQRSPSYVVSRPSQDTLAQTLRKIIPARAAYEIVRWRNVLLSIAFYRYARKKPEQTKKRLMKLTREELGPDYDLKHFTPRYNPWDQRVCLVPDSDLFKVLKSGKASIVTDEIESFTETGLALRSGTRLDADIVVTATGLKLQLLGGIPLSVDGRAVDLSKATSYKGSMFSGVPNLAYALGYTNASWTLKCDLTSAYVCRLLTYMDRHGYESCRPVAGDDVKQMPLIDFSSGYIQRSIDKFPRQGDRKPWTLHQNYVLDRMLLKRGPVDDEAMHFTSRNTAEGRRAA